jgi:hypothetical protein
MCFLIPCSIYLALVASALGSAAFGDKLTKLIALVSHMYPELSHQTTLAFEFYPLP